MEIHSRKMQVSKKVNYGELARSTDEFNGAQLKAVCVEAGMIALREGSKVIGHEHFLSGVLEVQSKKKNDQVSWACCDGSVGGMGVVADSSSCPPVAVLLRLNGWTRGSVRLRDRFGRVYLCPATMPCLLCTTPLRELNR